MLGPDEASAALGAPIGGTDAVAAAMDEACSKAERTRKALIEIQHAPTEMVLTRLCGDVAKVTYNLRLNGDIISDSQLEKHDNSMRSSLEGILGGHISDAAWMQAAMGVRHGGLGLREAKIISLSAFLASRVASRPHVCELAGHMQEAGLATSEIIIQAYDRRTEDALIRLVTHLDAAAGATLVDTISLLADTAHRQWEALFDESADGASDPEARRLRRPGAGQGLVPDDEDEDNEHPDAGTATTTLHIQRKIFTAIDVRSRGQILANLRSEGDASGERRLRELRHKDNDHTWMWALSKHKGHVLQPEEYVEAIRIRLGVAGPSDPVPCHLCGGTFLDSAGAHAHCCSRAESTRGHNCVVRAVFDVAAQCDPNSEHEAQGLIPGTLLRPADVLTGALGVGLTALDIGISSPDATNAGDDCCAAMYAHKVDTYAPHAAALDRQNITYEPMVWSAYGRPHPHTTTILRTLATRLARRRGCSDAEWRYKRLRATMGVEVWRRGAKMVRSCWPGGGETDDELDGHGAVRGGPGPPAASINTQ